MIIKLNGRIGNQPCETEIAVAHVENNYPLLTDDLSTLVREGVITKDEREGIIREALNYARRPVTTTAGTA